MAERWTFITNHAVVLLAIARDPHARLRDVAERVGLTERAVFNIVDDLCESGYLTKVRDGRRVNYELHPRPGLRHPAAGEEDLHRLVEMLSPPPAKQHRRAASPA